MFTYILVSNKMSYFQGKKINFLLGLNIDNFIIWIFIEGKLKIMGYVPTVVLPKNAKTFLYMTIFMASLTSLLKIDLLKTKT